ncbi:hypothetical protein G7Y89_g10946 [Cudoniella acicularis]|uniref:NADH dehydrogenase [ubiquinone] 1 alpha subcomplex subunit n=1 Tax=Cudoniella acicularis TaxID=354080 RepID=A0A8H4W0G3_9HELO|nr:hypothetical protein G7Y89_g10946 [Cudoniella acicularis]
MSSSAARPIKKAWYKWKTQRWVPWRKRFLVGLDLQGNTFWEFRDTLNSHQHRMRRIIQYPSATQYSEIKISPQWHQWLRHTRRDPPSLTEQSQDLVRQRNLKVLAAAADARWAAKPSVLDAPGAVRGQPLSALRTGLSPNNLESNYNKSILNGDQGELIDMSSGTQRPTNSSQGKPEVANSMQVPDGIRHRFNERPVQEKEAKQVAEKEKTDPWKQDRGGPSEQWQPKSWEGNIAPARR